eukprot:scaffold2145_cov309-Prasinococcus_capsulatus_cf.AAC.9
MEIDDFDTDTGLIDARFAWGILPGRSSRPRRCSASVPAGASGGPPCMRRTIAQHRAEVARASALTPRAACGAEDNGRFNDPRDGGQVVFDPAFEFGSEDTQRWLKDFCTTLAERKARPLQRLLHAGDARRAGVPSGGND